MSYLLIGTHAVFILLLDMAVEKPRVLSIIKFFVENEVKFDHFDPCSVTLCDIVRFSELYVQKTFLCFILVVLKVFSPLA